MRNPSKNHQRGIALPAALVLLLIIAAMAIGMIHMVQLESRVGGTDLDVTSAYYASEAGMEKMMSDLSSLFVDNLLPSESQMGSMESSKPQIEGIEYPEYRAVLLDEDQDGTADSSVVTLDEGTNSGMQARVVPLQLLVTGRTRGGTEVRMARDVDVALLHVFQFGSFYEGDLSVFPGGDLTVEGRVHANGNIFVAPGSGGKVLFTGRATASEEVIRRRLDNDLSTDTSGYTGAPYFPTLDSGCNGGAGTTCQALAMSEASKVDGPESEDNTAWPGISLTDFRGMVLDGTTGARPLDLAVSMAKANPIEIIRRSPAAEDPDGVLGRSRLYNQAHIRILLNDEASDLPGGFGRELANDGQYFDGVTYGLTDTAFASVGSSQGDPLIGGFMRVEALQGASWQDVTGEWLDLGIARENPDAILKFQTVRYDPNTGEPNSGALNNLDKGQSFWPINLYDAREGELRDLVAAGGDCAMAGVINVIELDVANLNRWLSGQIGLTGSLTEADERGYTVYFSDRRGQVNNDGYFGFEDMVNPGSASGLPDGALFAAEDVNASGVLDTYGNDNIGLGFGMDEGDWNSPYDRIACTTAQESRVSGARHGLKLVNGSLGNLPMRPDSTRGGLTVASENPVYVQGDFNAIFNGDFDTDASYASAAIVADAVTFLSNDWQDWQSFLAPTDPSQRPAGTTAYRVAVATGTNVSFDRPVWGNDDAGTNGGLHNLVRLLEDWGNARLRYQGSLSKLFFSTQAVGIYKCCSVVYNPPREREFSFEFDFELRSQLPPGEILARDVINRGYQQIFDPSGSDFIETTPYDGQQGGETTTTQ